MMANATIGGSCQLGFEGLLGGELESIVRADFELRKCGRSDIEQIIKRHHYSKKMPVNPDLCFRVFYRGKPEGALSVGYGIRPEIKDTWGVKIVKGEMREFDRMWLSDIPPRNSESIVISLLARFIRKSRTEVRFLLSYADGSAGNIGTIYRASNFIELPPIRADFYVLESGERVHPVSMWHRHKTRAWAKLQEIYPGIKHIRYGEFTGRQYRFVLPLYSGDRKLLLTARGKARVEDREAREWLKEKEMTK